MADELSYSFSVSPNDTTPAESTAQAASADTGAPLVAFATCELIPVDQQMTLVINRENGHQQLLAPQLVEALKTCTRFDTVANHAARLCRTWPELKGQDATVAQTIEQLREAGFLLESSTICARLNQSVNREVAPTRVFIITCDRPEAVQRLLDSMLESSGLMEHESLVLIDDSREPANQAANADIVERFGTQSAKTMTYFGADAQHTLMVDMIQALPEHENGIRFLLDREQWADHPTYGRSRTLSLLLSVGYRAIVLDDDILCRAVRPAVPEVGISVGTAHGRSASFFPDRDDLMAHAVVLDQSPLALHARYLGHSLGETVQHLSGGELGVQRLAGSNAAMTNIWSAESPVLITQSGAWGDPGTGDSHWIMSLDEYSVSRLLAAPQGFVAAVEGRNVWLGSAKPSIVKMGNMSQMTGLDNTALLPPYFTAFRGEDLLFASMVEALHPRGAVLEQGFAVPHLPDLRSRPTLKDPIANAGSISLFAAYLTNRIDYTDANDPSHRLAMLSQDFRRLADKSDYDLILDYRREVARGHALGIHSLVVQKRQTADMNSANWTGYLDRGISELQQALSREWSPKDIDDLSPDIGLDEIIAGFRGYLRGYADALDGWEAMREIAAQREL